MNDLNPYQTPNETQQAESFDEASETVAIDSLGQALWKGIKISVRLSTRIAGPLAICLCLFLFYITIRHVNSGNVQLNDRKLPMILASCVSAPVSLSVIVVAAASLFGATFSAIEYAYRKWEKHRAGR